MSTRKYFTKKCGAPSGARPCGPAAGAWALQLLAANFVWWPSYAASEDLARRGLYLGVAGGDLEYGGIE